MMIKKLLPILFLLFAVNAHADFETLYVDACDDTKLSWTTETNNPYLDDDNASLVHEDKTAGATVGDFGFANTATGGTNDIDAVTLYFECQNDDGNDGFFVYLDTGGGFASAGAVACTSIGTYAYETLVVTSVVDTWTKVDALSMYLNATNSGAGDDRYVRRAYMYIEHSEPVVSTQRFITVQ